jgi:hypothetical protein
MTAAQVGYPFIRFAKHPLKTSIRFCPHSINAILPLPARNSVVPEAIERIEKYAGRGRWQ